VAKGVRVQALRVKHKGELDSAIEAMLNSRDPYLLGVMVSYQEHVLLLISSGQTVREDIRI